MNFNDLLSATENRIKEYRELKQLGMILKSGEFFPAGVHYPPITDYDEMPYDEMFRTYTMPENGNLDIYVHFPFCSKRCLFCHYPSLYNNDAEKEKYIDALEKNFDIYLRTLGIDKIKLQVALVGGGTPTDLSPKLLERFLQIIHSKCDMSKVRQFNYDVSPHTLIGEEGIERLKILRDYGVDRLTIGIQSMNDEVLKLMNRPHNKKEALEAVKNTMDMGFQTNIEFIYGHPGQTLESWYNELKEIVNIDSHEYQFYRLKITPYGDQQGTIQKYQNLHQDKFPNDEDCIRMKQMIFYYLASFGIYENLRRVFTRKRSYISLYAYNQCCDLVDQIGLGLTAFSSLRDRFVLNTQHFDQYYQRIENGLLPFNRGIVRTKEQLQRWAFILSLKNYFMRKKRFQEVTGTKIEDTVLYPVIQKIKQFGLIEETDKIIKLTEKGVIFGDEVVRLFYEPKYLPAPREGFNEGALNPYTVAL